jgi:hypothetical protein
MLSEINTDVRTTLARLETLIARLIPTGENGRERQRRPPDGDGACGLGLGAGQPAQEGPGGLRWRCEAMSALRR